jgi:hypothetical protein
MLHLIIYSSLSSLLVLLVSHFSFLATNLMSSRWVYHHRRENGVTLENWSLYCDFWEQHTPTPVHSEKTAKHNTHHYILPRSLCIITLSLFSRDRGFSCLEIPISVVIWIGFWGRGKKENDAIPTSGQILLCSVSVGSTACTINTFLCLRLAICSKQGLYCSVGRIRMDGWID